MDVEKSESKVTINTSFLEEDSIESYGNDETFLDKLGRVIIDCCKMMVNEMHGASLNVGGVKYVQILQMEYYTREIHDTWRKAV